jgi:prolyl-tRNA editing enzyme YbaK/EbsC (Cys-tRNA(Pro) deacylase)
MTLPVIGDLEILPALEHLDWVGPPVAQALRSWAETDSRVASRVGVARIDPADSDTATLVAKRGLTLDSAANCVVVAGRREGQERVAAALVRGDTRADVNGVIRRLLNVRKASFMDQARAVAESGMEYGGITPLGVPGAWRILVDAALPESGDLLIGAGVRAAKIAVPGELLATLPGAKVVSGLAR